jgi:DNA-binding transcriptional ArsR family regulator
MIAMSMLLAPGTVNVKLALDPVYNNLASLYLLTLPETPGINEWVKNTAAALTAAQMRTHRVVKIALYSAYEPDEDWSSFPAYLDALAERDPTLLRARFLNHMFPDIGEEYASRGQMMDLETFIAQIDRGELDHEFDHDLFAEAYALLNDPPTLRETVVSHLTSMWDEHLAAEWERNEATLRQVVTTFQESSYIGLTAYEAIKTITGREAHGNWQDMLAKTETLVFVPSPHIGPYLMNYAYPPVTRMLFDAHRPRVARGTANLTQIELLVQLRTLADETRLSILDLLLREGELCAQDIIARLDLAKSSGSRHLSQLSAAGYLRERQGVGKAKCYAINPDRFRETLRFLDRYTKAS